MTSTSTAIKTGRRTLPKGSHTVESRTSETAKPSPGRGHEADKVSIGVREYESPTGLDHIQSTQIHPDEVSTETGRQAIADELLKHMEAYPSVTSVIGVVSGEKQTDLIVADRPGALEADQLQGSYEIIARLASSESIKANAKEYPSRRYVVTAFDEAESTDLVKLPGPLGVDDVNTALTEGMKVNNDGLYDHIVDNLPETGRAIILLPGPSKAGKSYQMHHNLLTRLHERFPDREVLKIEGDNYFADIDAPDYPFRDSDGSIVSQESLGEGADSSGLVRYWDHYDVLDHDLLLQNLTELVEVGETQQPIYNFLGHKGDAAEWDAKFPFRGVRTGEQKVQLGENGILVLDNVHAGNKEIVERLQELGIHVASAFIDTPNVNDRLVRGIVRDADSRSLTPSQTLGAWDGTNRPGEKEFIYPTLKALDPAKDIFYLTSFDAEPRVGRKVIEHKAGLIEHYGLQPGYHHFELADDRFPQEAKRQEAGYLQTLADPQESEEHAKAQARLERLRDSDGYISTSRAL